MVLVGDDGQHHYQEALRIARGNAALAAERAGLCAKLAYMMAMVPGSFRANPDPNEVDRLVDEGLAAAGDDEASRARLMVAKGGSARLWRGSEPFGQGTQPDPSPIKERIASVHAALEVGQRRGLDGSSHLPPRRSASSTGSQAGTTMRSPSPSGASRGPRPAPGKSSWTPSGPQRY